MIDGFDMRRNNFYADTPKKPKSKGLGPSGTDMAKKQEKRVAKRSDGRRTPASGALPFAKGDVETRIHLLECKTTGKKSLRVEQKWLAKIARESRMKLRDPGLVVSFPDMPSDVEQDWVMLPLNVFRRLVGDEGRYCE
jgi:hypothetical protein